MLSQACDTKLRLGSRCSAPIPPNRETVHAILYFRRGATGRRPGVWALAIWLGGTSATFESVGRPTKTVARFKHKRYPGSVRISRIQEGKAMAVFLGRSQDQLLSAFVGWLVRSGGGHVERIEIFLDEPTPPS